LNLFRKKVPIRAAQVACDAAAARAADAEREAAATQQERDAADARLWAALERAAHELTAAAPPPEDEDAAKDAEDFASDDGRDPLRTTLVQHEAAARLNLHTQAVAV